jgi:hypothetical protein
MSFASETSTVWKTTTGKRGMEGLDKGGQGPISGCCAIEEEEEYPRNAVSKVIGCGLDDRCSKPDKENHLCFAATSWQPLKYTPLQFSRYRSEGGGSIVEGSIAKT